MSVEMSRSKILFILMVRGYVLVWKLGQLTFITAIIRVIHVYGPLFILINSWNKIINACPYQIKICGSYLRKFKFELMYWTLIKP